jgi:4-hydroxy-L-threonine phosphate dehydrogenase PdxA
LVTTHLGIHQVSAALTREKIRRTVFHTVDGLQKFWGVQKPRIAVTALNPHAGESGLFGSEEIDIIQPEISHLNRKSLGKFEVEGPFPADTLFAKHILRSKKDRWDAVVCMYHDQGLIPVKLLDFHRTVNITLGLPIVRTSVDHGVGFDIKGKGIADASSLLAAIELAARIVKKRAKTK